MNKTKKTTLIISIVIIVLILAAFLFRIFSGSNDSGFSQIMPGTAQSKNDDPTGTSEKNNPKPSESTVNEQNTQPKKNVGVGVTFAGIVDGSVEVRAFISGVIEGSGTCTATFSKEIAQLNAESTAFIDATTSQCDPIRMPLSKFSESGAWNLVVTYESLDSKGESESIRVDL